MHNIVITTDCVSDLPRRICNKDDVHIIYFDIETEKGLFRDTVEIDSQNVMEYVMGGNKSALSVVPTANEFKNFFEAMLKEYEEIIHISISSKISSAYENAVLARVKMGRDGNKVHILDSKHLSSGQGLVTIEAVRWRNLGMDSRAIMEHLEQYVNRVSTSFLTNNAEYLYYNNKVSKLVRDVCDIFKLHPILEIRDGKLCLKNVYIGEYERAAEKYIKRILSDAGQIETQNGFITYAGCSEDLLDRVQKEVETFVSFENLYRKQASATVSSNCGPKTFGILFVKKEKE